MLLKSLKLVNFRQFLGEQIIDFATNDVENVTIIMGENGTGKTTFAQAFTWCLYGDTDFEDKSVLNRSLASNISFGEDSTVRVELDLIHNNIDYTVIREQIYKKDNSGKLKASNTIVKISYKKKGQQEFVRSIEVDNYIKQILPKELSRYFFFDGERIDKMSKDIKKGKSQDFKQAVRGLLGLNAFIEALSHLKPTSKYGVIGSYNESYDSKSDKRIADYTSIIQTTQDELDKIEERLNDIGNEIELAQEKCNILNLELSKQAETEKLQERKLKLYEQVEKRKQLKSSNILSIFKSFNSNPTSYFAKSLILKSLESLSQADKLDKGIPDINARTIEFLIRRGFCVCGTQIDFGQETHTNLIKALDYLPPKSIGGLINDFVTESEIKTRNSEDLFEIVQEKYKKFREDENELEVLISDIQTIEKQMEGKEGIGNLQLNLSRYEKVISDCNYEKDNLNKRKGAHETTRDRVISERTELTLRDEKNKKIEIYKAYAQTMFDELTSNYEKHENQTRQKLEEYVNLIFKNIYKGGMSIKVDDKYNIQVVAEDDYGYSNEIETSTAQSISVIFAFISGIIKMARENLNLKDDENHLLDSEPYPLVMDAPLSAFDRRRINTVCEVLPNIAEQVIIFIKDTDGELAEQNMGKKVGKRYLFDKKNEFETYLIKR